RIAHLAAAVHVGLVLVGASIVAGGSHAYAGRCERATIALAVRVVVAGLAQRASFAAVSAAVHVALVAVSHTVIAGHAHVVVADVAEAVGVAPVAGQAVRAVWAHHPSMVPTAVRCTLIAVLSPLRARRGSTGSLDAVAARAIVV